jgi:hypothetical protein
VRDKFLSNFGGDPTRGEDAAAVIERLEDVDDIREITALLSAS